MVRKHQTTDAQLRIGESRDSGFDAVASPRNDVANQFESLIDSLCPANALATARGGDDVQAVVAEHMRHEFERLEYFREGRIADAQAAGVGAEGGHHRTLAIGGKAAPLHRPAARRDP